MAADNKVTLDRAVLMVEMIAGFEVEFAWLLQVVMHKRAFKVTTTYPFSLHDIFLMKVHMCAHPTH